jgi:hypothetical protein
MNSCHRFVDCDVMKMFFHDYEFIYSGVFINVYDWY